MMKEGQGQTSPNISPTEIYRPKVHLPVSDAYFMCLNKETGIEKNDTGAKFLPGPCKKQCAYIVLIS